MSEKEKPIKIPRSEPIQIVKPKNDEHRKNVRKFRFVSDILCGYDSYESVV